MNVTNTSNSRNYLFDNLRALLIFLVVFGHILTEQIGSTTLIRSIYYFIFMFHMPAFIFVSGYFSKNAQKSRETAVKTFFIPYITFNTIFWILGRFDLFESGGPFRIFSSVWGLWFLLVVFIWKILLKDIIKIKCILPISFLVGVLSGLSQEFAQKLALGRLVAFLPFFLLGYYCKETFINKLRSKKYLRAVACSILAFFAITSYMMVKYKLINKEYFYMRLPFDKIGDSPLKAIVIRGLLYISAILITFAIIYLLQSKKTWFSMIGQNSITIYVLHLVTVSNLRKLNWSWDGTNYYIIYALITSIVITYLFSRQFVISLYNKLMTSICSLIFRKEEK